MPYTCPFCKSERKDETTKDGVRIVTYECGTQLKIFLTKGNTSEWNPKCQRSTR